MWWCKVKKFTHQTAQLLLLSLLTCLLASCGFTPRSRQELPAQISSLYVKSPHPEGQATQAILQLFRSLAIPLKNTPSEAAYTLAISQIKFSHDQPSITTSNQALTYSYRLQLSYQLLNKKNQTVVPLKTLNASRQVIMNANQIYTNNVGPFIHQQLIHEMTTLLFDQLISQNTQKALGGRKKLHKQGR